VSDHPRTKARRRGTVMADDLVQRAPTAVGVDERVGDRRAGRGPVVPGDRTRSRDWRVAGPACLVLVVALLSGACGGGSASPAATPVTVEAPADTPPPSTSEQPITMGSSTAASGLPGATDPELLSAYLGYVEAYRAANDPPDPEFSTLSVYAGGVVLDQAREVASQSAALGIRFRQPDGSRRDASVRSSRLEGNRAVAQVCFVDDGLIVETTTGRILNDQISTQQWIVGFDGATGRWIVDFLSLVHQAEGAIGCA